MINRDAIGHRIAELRRVNHITQDALAAVIGVSRSTLAGIERGRDSPGLASTIAIADHFKVPMDWLLGRQVPPGGPLVDHYIDDLDEIAWVRFWRSLTVEERMATMKMLHVPPASSRNAA